MIIFTTPPYYQRCEIFAHLNRQNVWKLKMLLVDNLTLCSFCKNWPMSWKRNGVLIYNEFDTSMNEKSSLAFCVGRYVPAANFAEIWICHMTQVLILKEQPPKTKSMIKRSHQTKSSITQRLWTFLGLSVGVTTVTRLVWLADIGANVPNLWKSFITKRSFKNL